MHTFIHTYIHSYITYKLKMPIHITHTHTHKPAYTRTLDHDPWLWLLTLDSWPLTLDLWLWLSEVAYDLWEREGPQGPSFFIFNTFPKVFFSGRFSLCFSVCFFCVFPPPAFPCTDMGSFISVRTFLCIYQNGLSKLFMKFPNYPYGFPSHLTILLFTT